MDAPKSAGFTFSLKVVLVEDASIGGFTAYIKQFPHIIAEGDTEEEAMKNLIDAMHDVAESLNTSEIEKEGNVKVIEKSVNFEAQEMV